MDGAVDHASDTSVSLEQALAASIDSWYAGDLERGRAACEFLLANEDLSSETRAMTMRNLASYARQLKDLAPGATFTLLPRIAGSGWSWFNPSIAAGDDGAHILVRSSNYSIQPGRRYVPFDQDGIIRTQYFRMRLDQEHRLRDVSPIIDPDGGREASLFPVSGYEDCRLVHMDGRWLALATSRDRNAEGTCQQVVLGLEANRWTTSRELSAPGDGHQKNWMPFVRDGSLLAVTQCHPLTVIAIDPDAGTTEVVVTRETSPVAASFRGGSQGVDVDGGVLFVIHEAVDRSPEDRIYLHRFVRLDGDLHLTHISTQFFLTQRGIEYCAGMARFGDELVLSLGVNDEEAYLAYLPVAEVMGLLRPVGDLANFPDVDTLPTSDSGDCGERSGLVSVTLAGPGTASMIGDALRSVIDHVDQCLVIDTGIGPAGIAEAREVAGDRLLVETLAWPGDFAAARTASLDLAARLDAAWAVVLDTDERLDIGGADLRGALSGTEHAVLNVASASGTYAKPRFFRLPAPGAWVGATHEYFDRARGTAGGLDGVSFREEGKSPDALQHKLRRDVELLEGMIAGDPRNARWWYYLGDTLANLGDRPGAIAAFQRCATLDGWNEEAAWARYREAECWLALGNHGEAVRSCASGLALHPGIAELAWLAGFACWGAKRYEDAIRWSELAIVHGEVAGHGAVPARTGFRNPVALHEGPYDVLRYAWRALGHDDAADEAERKYQLALAQRLREGVSPNADLD